MGIVGCWLYSIIMASGYRTLEYELRDSRHELSIGVSKWIAVSVIAESPSVSEMEDPVRSVDEAAARMLKMT